MSRLQVAILDKYFLEVKMDEVGLWLNSQLAKFSSKNEFISVGRMELTILSNIIESAKKGMKHES